MEGRHPDLPGGSLRLTRTRINTDREENYPTRRLTVCGSRLTAVAPCAVFQGSGSQHKLLEAAESPVPPIQTDNKNRYNNTNTD